MHETSGRCWNDDRIPTWAKCAVLPALRAPSSNNAGQLCTALDSVTREPIAARQPNYCNFNQRMLRGKERHFFDNPMTSNFVFLTYSGLVLLPQITAASRRIGKRRTE